MNGRITGNVMSLEHFHDFYFLEALQAEITMAYSAHPEWQFKHSVNRLEADVKQAFAELTHEMAFRIYVYLYAASLGEARHAEGMGMKYYISGLHGSSRHNVYNMSLDYFPSDQNVKILKDVFDQNWGGSYGGKAWLNIVEAMDMYGKVSDATFIDHSVDLEHNGGCVFNKSAKFGLNCELYSAYFLKSFLDFKFSGNILEKPIMNGDTAMSTRISRKVYNLIERYINTCLTVGTGKYVRTLVALYFLRPELDWLKGYTVDWGNKELKGEGKKPVKVTKKPGTYDLKVGKKYLVKYDGRSHNCGWMSSMGNGTVITATRVIRHHNGQVYVKSGGYYYAKEWLHETTGQAVDYGEHVRKIEADKRYIIHFNGVNCAPSWVAGMDEKDGKVVKFTSVTDDGYGLCGSWLYNKKWVFEYKKEDKIPPYGYAYVKDDAKTVGSSFSFLSDMECMLGKNCKIVSTGQYTTLLLSENGGTFYMPNRWLILPRGFVTEERRREEHVVCASCGEENDSDYDLYYSSVTGEMHCESCYDDKFKSCDKCGHEMWSDDAVDGTNHNKYYWMCKSCAREEMVRCEICSEWHQDYVVTKDDGDVLCDKCSKDKYCERCERFYWNIEKHIQSRHNRRNDG